MQKILILGAGRSATALIHYLLEQSSTYDWKVTVCDHDLALAASKVQNHPNGSARQFDVEDRNSRAQLIQSHDMVVSLLPAALHIQIAEDCVAFKKNLATASYVSKEMKAMEQSIVDADLTFLNEMGLDPGLDHMSAMQKIEEIKQSGGELTAFYSHTGGLVAPESDNNPWHYKITWNPRNVVLAGQGTAQYQENHKMKFVPYHRLFDNLLKIHVPNLGWYEVYPNRDSVSYKEIYKIEAIPTILRGTIRHEGYCEAWNLLVKIGYTDGNTQFHELDHLTYRELTAALTNITCDELLEANLAQWLGLDPRSEAFRRIEWMGILEDRQITRSAGSLADVLEQLLLDKWKLEPTDKDMIIMQHIFHYRLGNEHKALTSTMIAVGEDSNDTAMSRLVGITLGIGVKLLMTGKIRQKGIVLPTEKSIYEPALLELRDYGVHFRETEELLG